MKVFFFCERREKGTAPDLLLLVRPVISTKYIKYFNQSRKLSVFLDVNIRAIRSNVCFILINFLSRT
jgi:hypothetical protein